MKRICLSVVICLLVANPLFAQTEGVVVPPPVTAPSLCLMDGILWNASCEALILNELRKHEAAEKIEREKAEAFRLAVGHEYQKFFTFVAKYVAPAVTAWLIAAKVTK